MNQQTQQAETVPPFAAKTAEFWHGRMEFWLDEALKAEAARQPFRAGGCKAMALAAAALEAEAALDARIAESRRPRLVKGR